MCISKRQSGLTLVELIIAIVIIGVSVAGVIALYVNAVRGSADPLPVKQAYAIAEALLEEVQLAPFTFCDPADPQAEAAAGTGDCTLPLQAGNRPFDHVDKYNGLALNPVASVDGVALAGLAGYAATVTVAAPAAAWNGIPAADVRRITVTVAAPGGPYVLEGWRTRFAPNAVP